MRVFVAAAPWLVACGPSDDVAPPVPTDDAPAPLGCDGPVAAGFYGDTPTDVLEAGDLRTLEQGPQNGFHMELGIAVRSPTAEIAWNVLLYDVVTNEVVGAASPDNAVYTALTAWNTETCLGYLPAQRVFIGDGTEASADLACGLGGQKVRAEAFTGPLEDLHLTDAGPELVLELSVLSGC